MPLINCPDCHKEVSSRASACIHCGCPISSTENVVSDLPKVKPIATTEDQVFFESKNENILISNRKIQIGKQTFNVNMINSYQTKELPHPKIFSLTLKAIITRLLGIGIFFFFGIGGLGASLKEKEPEMIGTFLVLSIVGFIFGVIAFRSGANYISQRDELESAGMLTFVTSSGRSKVKITSYEDVLKMAEALDKVM